MINRDNIEDVLIFLGYVKLDDIYVYEFENVDCKIMVDIKNEKIIYPEDKGFIVNEKQTCNFSNLENFVVLECVHRLFKKGYRPEHIELEKRWSLGHTKKSGRADICVKNREGIDTLFIIECKTYGKEYINALTELNSDGGQLFSYLQQERSAKWLMLYASTFKENTVVFISETISIIDDPNIEKSIINKKNENVKLYKNAYNKESLFLVWEKTYNKKTWQNIIFGKDTVAYKLGEKPIRKKDLKNFYPNDKIVNSFEEILRHNNVSDKENAFNKLIALFICKLVDEILKTDEDIMEFQYKQGTDTYESLQDRLQRLHKDGMEKFMREKILYVSNDYPVWLFEHFTGKQRKNAIEDLKEKFKILKFYSNNDFAFKDVHNEELFFQNGKILVEMVQLFERYRIVYNAKHQFLGDLFEQLLNKGFKQNEGQFFTPTPIAKFIWESIPLENILNINKEIKYPKVIDYACGSGHFLTEGIDVINKIIGNNDNSWVSENIFGIEKDYRLARVSKVSLFMNGAGNGNIVFGDGLDNAKDKNIENEKFDILVANPPYSVKAFKNHLNLGENSFELFDKISDDGGEIEVLFIERIAQLLKPGAVAGVILPLSILSNNTSSYIGAREVLLKNFDIKSIVSLGSKTFGATGTNTVILFLKKHNEPPKKYKMIEDSINAIFENNFSDDWIDRKIYLDYLRHIEVDENIYNEFIMKKINYKKFVDNYFKMYVIAFENSSNVKKLMKKNAFKNQSEKEQNKILNKKFYEYVYEIEKDKLFFFGMIRENKTIIVTAPVENTKQKEFLGYDWSNRKGNEGIQINKMGGMLFDEDNRDDKKYIAKYIRDSFENKYTLVDNHIDKYIKLLEMKNMLNFKSICFNKEINIYVNEVKTINSKYKLCKIGDFLEIIRGMNYKKLEQVSYKTSNIVLTSDNITIDNRFELKKEVYLNEDKNIDKTKILKKGDIFMCFSNGSIKHLGKLCYIDKDTNYIAGGFMGILRSNSSNINSKYIYLLLSLKDMQNNIRILANGGNIKNLSLMIGSIKIPVPSVSIQESIVRECENVENEYNNIRMKESEYQEKIEKIFNNFSVINYTL